MPHILPTPEHRHVCIHSPIATSYLDLHESAFVGQKMKYNGAWYRRDGQTADKTPRYVFDREFTENES